MHTDREGPNQNKEGHIFQTIVLDGRPGSKTDARSNVLLPPEKDCYPLFHQQSQAPGKHRAKIIRSMDEIDFQNALDARHLTWSSFPKERTTMGKRHLHGFAALIEA